MVGVCPAGSSPRVRGKPRRATSARTPTRLIPARAGKTFQPAPRPLRGAAHPRACGENVGHVAGVIGPDGSSPRVRGKLSPGLPEDQPDGLIPARAGKTEAGRINQQHSTAHPRACGENFWEVAMEHEKPGSSPRVRGKLHCGRARRVPVRLIPACAGKTISQALRSCGGIGSSPRVRGKPREEDPRRPRRGLIPARAGKTTSPTAASTSAWAHPRACGENPATARWVARISGSSPRVRGKLLEDHNRCRDAGLIPARAGKTARSDAPAAGPQAHPRACGENTPNLGDIQSRDGSSPRVRGKRPQGHERGDQIGLIPARAGKTQGSCPAGGGGPAHPRACGENQPCDTRCSEGRGSSPRVRGKPSRWRR